MSRSHLVARNVVTTLATQIVTWVLAFAVTAYLPRYLGAVGMGTFQFAASLVGVGFVLVPLGTSTVLIKEIALDHGRAGPLISAAVVQRVALSVVIGAALIGIVTVLHYSLLIKTLVFVFSLSMMAGALDNAFASALQGLEKFSRQNLSVIINKIMLSVLTIILVMHKAPLWAFAAVVGATNVMSLLVNLSAFSGLFTTMRWPPLDSMRGLAMRGMPFMGWIVFVTLYGKTDPIVLERLTDRATVGWYGTAFRLIGSTLFLPSAVTLAMLPALSRMHKESEEGFKELARRTMTLVMLCGVPIALVCILLADRLIKLLHYPPTLFNTIPVLQVGGVGVLLWFAANVLGTVVMAADGQTKMMHTSMMAAIIGIPACIACSYVTKQLYHNGATGAMFSDVALELFLVCCYLRILPRGTFNAGNVKIIAKSIVAALPMAVFIWYTSSLWGFWTAIPGVAIYAVMCWILGCLHVRDLVLIKQAFARRANRAAGGGPEAGIEENDLE